MSQISIKHTKQNVWLIIKCSFKINMNQLNVSYLKIIHYCSFGTKKKMFKLFYYLKKIYIQFSIGIFNCNIIKEFVKIKNSNFFTMNQLCNSEIIYLFSTFIILQYKLVS